MSVAYTSDYARLILSNLEQLEIKSTGKKIKCRLLDNRTISEKRCQFFPQHPKLCEGCSKLQSPKIKTSKIGRGRAKVTWEQVRDIRYKFSIERYTIKELSDMFGVSMRLIGDIINNKTWKE